ncbi:hypothetical protein LTS14_006069 [Recurvomyces mirabilis]|uniref:uncharacterized protein n=1 Tax=Recurvomyces mirabilis TaxID=574656 RepID=UPI002DDFA401|nr:hypothetical protein LTS14_006069 [Recurvomyces mirabilis]
MAREADTTAGDPEVIERDNEYAASAADQRYDPYDLPAPAKMILSKGLSPDLFMPPPREEDDGDEAVQKPDGGGEIRRHHRSSDPLASAKTRAPRVHDEEEEDRLAAPLGVTAGSRIQVGRQAIAEEDDGEEVDEEQGEEEEEEEDLQGAGSAA